MHKGHLTSNLQVVTAKLFTNTCMMFSDSSSVYGASAERTPSLPFKALTHVSPSKGKDGVLTAGDWRAPKQSIVKVCHRRPNILGPVKDRLQALRVKSEYTLDMPIRYLQPLARINTCQQPSSKSVKRRIGISFVGHDWNCNFQLPKLEDHDDIVQEPRLGRWSQKNTQGALCCGTCCAHTCPLTIPATTGSLKGPIPQQMSWTRKTSSLQEICVYNTTHVISRSPSQTCQS